MKPQPVDPAGGWWWGWVAKGSVSPEHYDGTEVQACAAVECGVDDTIIEVVDDVDAQFWSTYVHLKEGGVECVGDFTTVEEARLYAEQIDQHYGWAP